MNSTEKDSLRADRAAMDLALRNAGATRINGKTCTCPFHDDRHPSASISLKDGVWLFNCHACRWGGDVIAVMAKAGGTTPEAILKQLGGGNGHAGANGNGAAAPKWYGTIDELAANYPNVEEIYKYTNDETAAVEMVVVRYHPATGGKLFAQARPARGGWENAAPPGKKPLYNRARLKKCDSPVVVEGEKKVHALFRLGIVATTSPGGANNAKGADWSPLNGKKRVTIWRDNDENGLKYQSAVIAELESLPAPPAVFVVGIESLDLPPKGDCVDFIAQWGDGDTEDAARAVRMALEVAQCTGAAKEVMDLTADIVSGKRFDIGFPWRQTTRLMQALLPGTVTLLCGVAGSKKSMLIMECLWRWWKEGVPTAVFELEDDRSFHIRRAVAQMAGRAEIMDEKWVKAHSEETAAILEPFKPDMDAFGHCVTTCPDNVMKLKELNEWIEKHASAGKKLLVIDPVTAADSGARPWIEDKEFLIAAKTTVRKYDARLILITHPRVGANKTPSLDSLAGGAAYARFSHSVAWLNSHTPKTALIETPMGNARIKIDTTLRIMKARNGRGAGLDIGFCFDGATLRFAEQGIIVKGNEDDDPSNSD